jgi:hypothetical protein
MLDEAPTNRKSFHFQKACLIYPLLNRGVAAAGTRGFRAEAFLKDIELSVDRHLQLAFGKPALPKLTNLHQRVKFELVLDR